MLSTFSFPEDPRPVRVWVDHLTHEPWFAAKDAADILGIVNPRNVVARLDADEKRKETVDTPRGAQTITVIRESAVYQMICRSTKPLARRFQRWLFHEILPTLRRQGLDVLQNRVRTLEHTLAQFETTHAQLCVFVENIKQRVCTEWIYIATNASYAARSVFKVGGCTSEPLLKKRLSTYNSGRAPGEELYYTRFFPCHNSTHLEARIKELLGDFRSQKEKEMYVMQYPALCAFLDVLTTHYRVEIDQLNGLLRDMLHSAVGRTPPEIPPPLLGPTPGVATDETNPPHPSPPPLQQDDDDDATVREWVHQYQHAHPGGPLSRRAFEAFVETTTGSPVARKRVLWAALKRVVGPEVELRWW